MEGRALEHNLFKPKNLEEGRHEVVGDCNGFTMQQRWDEETPLFAAAILDRLEGRKILDYGCGVGRLAKEILKQDPTVRVTGVDASEEMMQQALRYVDSPRFSTCRPAYLDNQKFDLAYLVYVLQHVPAIEIREILARINSHLKEDGILVYCSSDYRMAIRYDGQGFFDDRFLGVDLRAEVSRLFDFVGPLFTDSDLQGHPITNKMISGSEGGLAHPALVFKKKKIQRDKKRIPYFDMELPPQKGRPAPVAVKKAISRTAIDRSAARKILLLNRLSPGDILVMTNAIRDLSLAFPGKYQIDVRTPCNEIFEHNPRITKLQYDEESYNGINCRFSKTTQEESNRIFGLIKNGDKDQIVNFVDYINDILVIDMHYPIIHESGILGHHFCQGHRAFLEQILDVSIPQTSIRPEIFLSQEEENWPGPALDKAGVEGSDYWVINAGSKDDMSLKQYPFYQEVVDMLADKITFVQIGQKAHNHRPLEGAIDLVGKTNVRELFRLIAKSAGVLSCVSFPMHIAAAFTKPCVVVAGAREGTRWELYPNHQFIYVNGCLPCAPYDGCWRSKPGDCNNKVNSVPRCMTLIDPAEVVAAIMRYYRGGMLEGPLLSSILAEVAHE